MSRAKTYSAIHAMIFKRLCMLYFVGRQSLRMLFLKKCCELLKNCLCNFDPYAYHYVLIAIVKILHS